MISNHFRNNSPNIKAQGNKDQRYSAITTPADNSGKLIKDRAK